MRSSPRFLPILAGEVAAGIAAGVAYAVTLGRHLTLGLDAIWYLLVGGSLAAGNGYSNPSLLYNHGIVRATANFPPGFPVFLAGVQKLGITTPTGLRIVGAVCGGVTVLLTGLLGRRLTGRPGVGLVAAGLAAVLPALIAVDGSLMSETIAVPLTVAVLLAACWAAESSSVLRWAVVGLLAGLLVTVRSEDLLVAALLVPLAVLAAPDVAFGRKVLQVAAALVVAAAVVSPWVIRNATVFPSTFVLSTNDGKTLAGANCPSTYSGPLIGYWDYRCVGHPGQADRNEARTDQVLRHEGMTYLRAHWTRVPLVVSVRVLRAWGLYDPAQEARLQVVQTRSIGWQQLAWATSLALLVVAVAGVVRLRRNLLALVLIVGPPVVGTMAVAASFGNPRYVLSAAPSLCVAAGVAIVAVADRVRRRRDGARRGGAEPVPPMESPPGTGEPRTVTSPA